LFYRIYKSKKHNNNNNGINLIKKALISQPFVKLSSDECRKIMDPPNGNCKNKSSDGHERYFYEREVVRREDTPRHDLKIIIAKKSSSKNKLSFDSVKSGSHSKVRLNKPNSNGNSSSSKNDVERLRGNVDNFTSSVSSSEIASKSEMKTTLSKKSGTVSHHDLKLENKSNTKRHNNNDSHDFFESTMNEERGKEKQKRENTKHTNSSSSLSSSYFSSHHSASAVPLGGRNEGKFKEKANLSLNIPKLKIELPSLKTKITVPKTPNESYSISKSPFSNNSKCEPQLKKVRFDMSSNTVFSPSSTSAKSTTSRSLYDFDDETEENSCVDQKKYAAKIGLKPVERKVESIILQRKRKKSKHSKDIEHSSKRPKLHVSSSLDESLKLKLKIMGGKNCKSDKKNNEEEAYERTCNLKGTHYKTSELGSINVHKVKQQQKKQQQHDQWRAEKQKEADFSLENHKYSVTEQKISKNSSSSSDSNQPMVFIPKLVLQKATSTQNVSSFTLSTSPSSSSTTSGLNKKSSKEGETIQVQRKNSFFSDQEHKFQQQQEKHSKEDINKTQHIKIKVKPLDKPATVPSNQKLMKPPTAKMGSPSSDFQAQISSSLASSPIRPNSIPASLKLSPISIKTSDLKRSLSIGAEKSPHCYINPYAKSNTEMFTREPPLVKIPPLIPTTQTIRNFYSATFSNNNNNNEQTVKHSIMPVTISKINVKDPMKLFPNACPSVEILKIPQAAPIVNQEPLFKNVKLNRPMPPTIPLVKIKQTAQNPSIQKILPKSNLQQFNSNQNLIKTPNYQGHKMTSSLSTGSKISIDNESFSTEICQSPISQSDLSLARYHYELSKDIAKLDHNLSLEMNFEDWMKKQEFSKTNFTSSQSIRNLMNQQMNLSVRNIPNPSALMMFRNQNNNSIVEKSSPKSPTSTTVSSPSPSQMVISSTSEHPDIEEVITKSTISKGTEKSFFSESNNLGKSSINKINDKKSIDKLTEYLRLTATAAQSKEVKQDDDNNNNNSPSTRNDKSFNLIDTNSIVRQKSSSVDVICIDS
jgi:hypothetical protein